MILSTVQYVKNLSYLGSRLHPFQSRYIRTHPSSHDASVPVMMHSDASGFQVKYTYDSRSCNYYYNNDNDSYWNPN